MSEWCKKKRKEKKKRENGVVMGFSLHLPFVCFRRKWKKSKLKERKWEENWVSYSLIKSGKWRENGKGGWGLP